MMQVANTVLILLVGVDERLLMATLGATGQRSLMDLPLRLEQRQLIYQQTQHGYEQGFRALLFAHLILLEDDPIYLIGKFVILL
jgi:hypothetical protein